MLPLMDMIFLLLVIFIFMIVQMRPGFGISVDLPRTGEHAEQTDRQQPLTISITAENEMYLNAEPCTMNSLPALIKKRLADNKGELSVILRGDAGADYGQVMKVFTACRENNINSIIFDFEAASSGKSVQ